MSKSSISAGEIIRQCLIEDTNVRLKVSKIYPIIEDTAELPYIVYRRSGMQQNPVKTGMGADTIIMQVMVYAKSYAESVEIAEAVRDCLDGAQMVHLCSDFGVSFDDDDFGGGKEGLVMRSCYLTDCQEAYMNDAYVQNLIFTVKIGNNG